MRIYSFVLITASLLAIAGCKKHKDNISLSSDNPGGFDGAIFSDTFGLIANTVREDSLRSDSLTYNLLGYINDPIFGAYSSATYTQVRLPQLNKVLSGTPDSAVLYLNLPSETAYYGDLGSDMSFKVYEVTEEMQSGKSYYSNTSLAYNTTAIGNWSGKFNLKDSIDVRSLNTVKRIPPTLRIRLSSTFTNKLFNATASDLSSQENFLQFLKGIAIVPDAPSSGNGAIVLMQLQSAYSKLSLYYSDTLQSDFVIDAGAKRINLYKVNNQPSELLQQRKFSKHHFDTTYIQCFAGAKTRIQLPSLLSLAKLGPVAINKAELVVTPLAGTYNSPYTVPKRLLLLQPDAETGLNYPILDFFESHYGGNYNSTDNTYTFNLTRHVQNLVNDQLFKGTDMNRGLFLAIPSDNPLTPSRLVLDTRKGTGIMFRLYYTKL